MKYLWLILAFASALNAQMFDDFSDGDFNQNPVWLGIKQNFEVDNENRLHLNAPRESKSSYLSTSTILLENPTWKMQLKLEFDPSSSNYLDWYLMANDSVLKNSTKAYFVRIGGAQDEVSLYRRINGEETKIIDGLNKRTKNNPVNLGIKVNQSVSGNWRLWVDLLDEKGWVLEGSVYDVEVQETSYSGVHCVYTVTRCDRFYFDYFSLEGSPIIDRAPPNIVSSSVVNDYTIQLRFDSEDLTTQNLSNFRLLPQSILPIELHQDGVNLDLTFEQLLPINDPFQLKVTNLSDTTGNTLPDTTLYFYKQKHKKFDIVINEVMMKPEPEVQLPNVEYIELFNRSPYPITLKSWQVKTNHTNREIPKVTIEANEYLLLTNPSHLDVFNTALKQALSPWVNLSNTQGYVGLMDEKGEIIHEIHYHKAWFQNANKERGGWSLEMIDPEHYCKGGANWGASNNRLGGTPGYTNSITTLHPNPEANQIESIEVIQSNKIQVNWIDNLYDSTLFRIDSSYFQPKIHVHNIQHVQNKTYIEFVDDLEAGRQYFFHTKELKDCYKNTIQQNREAFIKGVWPEEGAVSLNELLFNPKVGGYEYVELYNGSDEYIDLSKLYIGNYDSLFQEITNTERISIRPINLPPKSYLALCENKDWIISNYKSEEPAFFLEVDHLPNLPKEKGSIALSDLAYELIDKYDYHEDQHFSRLESAKGVALERLAPNSKKWYSASSTENYGTPGRKNSQFTYNAPSKTKLHVAPEVFTPNLDGREDFTIITLQPKAPVKATVYIYNKKGLIVQELCKSELITQKSNWIWNGLNEEKLDLPMGIYMIVVELWSSKGKPEYLKHPVVLYH